MPLPKIDVPLFTMVMPSTQQKLSCRPFLVKEEKILLMAQQAGEEKDIILAIKQILTNCIQDKTFDADKLTMFDVEYMFIQLRAKSVDNIVKLSYRDMEDDNVYDFEVNLEEVNITKDDTIDPKIKITEDVGIIMRYPSVLMIEQLPYDIGEDEANELLVAKCIDKVYDANNVYNVDEQTEEELEQFVDGLNVNVYNDVKQFFYKMPRLQYTIKYKNSLGNDRKIELNSLKDFFMWG